MDQKTVIFFSGVLAIIFLIIAVFGIINNVNIREDENPLEIAQSLSVFALALLSIGLFYRNHESEIEKLQGSIILKFFGWSCIVFFVILMPIIYILSKGTTIIPFFMASLAIGLYCGTYFLNNFTQEERRTPLGQLIIFVVYLAIAGTVLAYITLRINSFFK